MLCLYFYKCFLQSKNKDKATEIISKWHQIQNTKNKQETQKDEKVVFQMKR